MTAVNIHLPDELRAQLEARAAESGFASLDAYVEAMLRADVSGGPLIDEDSLEPLLLHRLDGPFVEANEADFRQMRAKLQGRLDSATGEPRP